METIKEYSFGKYTAKVYEPKNSIYPFACDIVQATPKGFFKQKILKRYGFKTLGSAETFGSEYITNQERAEAAKQARRAKNAEAKVSDFYKVGDIVVNTWGFEQTNVEFYQIVSMTEKTITVIEMTTKQSKKNTVNSMADYCLPDAVIPDGKKYTLRVKADGVLSNPKNHYYFEKWSGTPQYRSWYG